MKYPLGYPEGIWRGNLSFLFDAEDQHHAPPTPAPGNPGSNQNLPAIHSNGLHGGHTESGNYNGSTSLVTSTQFLQYLVASTSTAPIGNSQTVIAEATGSAGTAHYVVHQPHPLMRMYRPRRGRAVAERVSTT